MAYVISDDCIACGTCIDECPVGAISEGDKYSISLKVTSILSTPKLAQSAVLAQMFVLLKQFIREHNTILSGKTKRICEAYPFFIPTFIS